MKNPAYDLLPVNATALERGLALTSIGLYRVPTEINKIWDVELCPEPLLPWLAWAMSVDFWQEKWTHEQKREAIKESVHVHAHRGTRQAIADAILKVLSLHTKGQDNSELNFDNAFTITEWWEQEDDSQAKSGASRLEPLTFKVKLSHPEFQSGELQGELYHNLIQAINTVKPLTSRFTLEVGDLEFESELYLAGGITAMEMARFTANIMKNESGNQT